MSSPVFLGIDTSCYTTSIALVSGGQVVLDKRRMLKVPEGGRGLRQSEMVFEHIKNVPLLFEGFERCGISAVGYSKKPCGNENSYMPVFRVGESMAVSWAKLVGAEEIPLTHQHGHIYSAFLGKEIQNGEYCAFHVSGGTLDVLKVKIEGSIKGISKIGGTLDITCGQLIDRTGVLAGLPFPAGRYIEELYRPGADKLSVNVEELCANLSGAETQAKRALENGAGKAGVLSAVIDCCAETILRLIKNAYFDKYIFTGGVMANSVIRKRVREVCKELGTECIIAEKPYCSDNACGIALGAQILYREGEL